MRRGARGPRAAAPEQARRASRCRRSPLPPATAASRCGPRRKGNPYPQLGGPLGVEDAEDMRIALETPAKPGLRGGHAPGVAIEHEARVERVLPGTLSQLLGGQPGALADDTAALVVPPRPRQPRSHP